MTAKLLLVMRVSNSILFYATMVSTSLGGDGTARSVALADDDAEEDWVVANEEMNNSITTSRRSMTENLIWNETLELEFRTRDEFGSILVPPQLVPLTQRRMNEEGLQVTSSKPHKIVNWMILGDQIGKSAFSTVFDISTMPGYVIKYQVNCSPNENPIHELTKEYYYMKQLEGSGIAPRALYLSRETRIGNTRQLFEIDAVSGKISKAYTKKLNFNFSSWNDGDHCNDGRVRFMIMEKVGKSLDKILEEYPNGLQLSEALESGAEMIELIKRLHLAGFVHRDVHAGNFAKSLDGTRWYLIDFGLSGHASEVNEEGIVSLWSDRFSVSPLMVFHDHLSPWENWGYLSSYRDDYVRTLGLIGKMMYGSARYDEGIKDAIVKSLDEASMSMFGKKPLTRFTIINRKLKHILSGPGDANPTSLLPKRCEQAQDAQRHMDSLVNLLEKVNSKLETVFSVPNYTRVEKFLRATATVVRRCARSLEILH